MKILKEQTEIDTKCPVCGDKSYILVDSKHGEKRINCRVCHLTFNIEW